MCSVHSSDPFGGAARDYEDMSDGLFSRLAPFIQDAKAILFGGNGEPFLARRVEDRISSIRELNPDVRLSSFSNGLRFASKKFADRILSDMDVLMLSVNGSESYEEIMVDGKFSKLRQALVNISEHRARTGKPKQWGIEFILMRSNVDDIVPMAELALEFGADRVLYKDYWVNSEAEKYESGHHNPGVAEAMKQELKKASRVGQYFDCVPWPELSFHPQSSRRFQRGLQRASELWARVLRAVDMVLHDRDALMDRLEQFLPSVASGPPCRLPWSNLQVTVQGRVLICCARLTFVGDLNTQSPEEIWNGPEVQKYREGLRTGQPYKGCATCHLTLGNVPAAFEKITPLEPSALET